MIKIRNDNYEKYYDILSYRSNDFFIPEKSDRISSFVFLLFLRISILMVDYLPNLKYMV